MKPVFAHPARGTCNDPSCPWHGVCHCGCGMATNRGDRNWHAEYRLGQPVIFRVGHYSRWIASPLCPRGHDKSVTGRTTNGRCAECRRADMRAQKARTRLGERPVVVYVSAGPVRRLIARSGADAASSLFAARFGVHRASALARIRRMGPRLELQTADEWCIALGSHLAIVYPELYDEEVAA